MDKIISFIKIFKHWKFYFLLSSFFWYLFLDLKKSKVAWLIIKVSKEFLYQGYDIFALSMKKERRSLLWNQSFLPIVFTWLEGKLSVFGIFLFINIDERKQRKINRKFLVFLCDLNFDKKEKNVNKSLQRWCPSPSWCRTRHDSWCRRSQSRRRRCPRIRSLSASLISDQHRLLVSRIMSRFFWCIL